MTSDILARYPKPRPFLLADGTRLGWAFTSRIEAALKPNGIEICQNFVAVSFAFEHRIIRSGTSRPGASARRSKLTPRSSFS